MLRALAITALLLSLTACGCARDKGESSAIGDYWEGCWKAAKDRPNANNDDRIFPKY